MTGQGPDACLEGILALPGDDRWGIDRAHAVRNVSAYMVRSFDGNALIFAIPLLVSRPLPAEIPLDSRGSAGAVALIIERIKRAAGSDPGLGPLIGRGTRFPHQFASFTEPYTVVSSPSALASHLWHAGDRDFADVSGIHLLLNGAVPCPSAFTSYEAASVSETVARLCDAVAAIAHSLPVPELEAAWISTLDQQFAVAGSNAQGKTTFLEGIIAGMDDHARGDGRELVITVHGLCTAEAMTCQMTGADVSMFFSVLPPGIHGTVHAASGMGSGSMNMAHQVQRAVERHCPLLIIDEDRAAPNLLVRSCLQAEEVTPLSEILCNDRGKMGGTALLFAACAMDTLAAQADRIMLLDQHAACAVDREQFRERVALSLEKMAGVLREDRG